MSRITKDEYYMEIAKTVSKRSTCLKRQYGAVLVKNDEIISTGYNGSPRGSKNCCDIGSCKRIDAPHNSGQYNECHSVHAEMNAMISAKRSDMIGAALYLYGSEDSKQIFAYPCPVCERMLMNAGVEDILSLKIE